MKYKDIRAFQPKGLKTDFIICPYCYLLSPFFTKFFVKHHIIPNTVTILMILSGLLGAVLFAVPFLPLQILGVIFIHVWFILDCSDGEVARITKRFSTFGTEIDYTAHIINHPCFSLSFLLAVCFTGRYPMLLFGLLLFVFTALESMGRHLCSFHLIYDMKIPVEKKEERSSFLKGCILYIVNSLTVYPVFALVFPLLFFLDGIFGLQTGLGLLIVFVGMNLLVIPRQVYKWVKKIAVK
ncbi:MAG: CDP-alcohol phosphatidyltransferase family protein [Clostridia bacterium]